MIYTKLHNPGQLIQSVTVYAVMDRNDLYRRYSVAKYCEYAERTFQGEWTTKWNDPGRPIFCERRQEYVIPVMFKFEYSQEAQLFQFKYAQDTV